MNPITAFFAVPNARALFSLAGDARATVRLHFLYAAMQAGVLQALPASRDELAERLGIKRSDLLDSLLELGLVLKELSHSDGRFAIRGRRSRALVSEEGDQLFAMIEEMLTYHADVYRRLPARLEGAESGDYLDEHALLIARSSRMLDPFVKSFVRTVVSPQRPLRLLEVGCGSGIYLRYAAEANPDVTGVAVDLQPEVVERARENLRSWGLSDRFETRVVDIRRPPADLAGPFDLITLYNNVYYFAEDERLALFRTFHSWLTPDGRFALVSIFRGRTFMNADFDLALRCTVGCTPLPTLGEVHEQLGAGGFGRLETTKLMPGEPLYGVLARP